MQAVTEASFLLILLFLLWSPQVRGAGCSIKLTRASPSSMPQATDPGDLIVKFWFDLTTSDPSNTNLGVDASGSNTELISKSISKSSDSGSVYVRIRNSPGKYAYLSITITCQVDGYSDSDTLNLGKSYIVAIPSSWSVSISPTTISKKDRIALEASGLGAIDDGVGSLTVSAKLGSHTYSLSRISRGSFKEYASVNFVNQPAGSKSITFTVYKYYSGVSARDSKTRSFTVIGRPPEISVDIPPQVHRSDLIKITVSEGDGDSVSGSLSAFGKEYSLVRGDNVIEIPRDVSAGSYNLNAIVKDVDGSRNGSWTTTIVNVPPEVKLSIDKKKAVPGQSVKINVTAQDDSTELKVSLYADGKEIHEEWNLSENGETIFYNIPNDFEGDLSIEAEAVDMDGATASSNAQIEVGRPPVIEGGLPLTVHRGDKYKIEIRGTNVSGSISYMNKEIDADSEGFYTIEIPKDAKQGKYKIEAVAKNDFGWSSKIWDVLLENIPPKVEISLDKDELRPGDNIAISVRATDDSSGVKITIQINDSIYHFEGEGVAHYSVPSNASQLKIVVNAIDIDGAEVSYNKIVTVHRTQTISVTMKSSATSTTSAMTTATSTEGLKTQRTTSERSKKVKGHSKTISEYEHSRSSTSITSIKKKPRNKSKREIRAYEARFNVAVIPSNPTIGQNVTVMVTPSEGVKGRIWILNPSRRTVADFPVISRRVIYLLVNVTGNWSVRWAYIGKGTVKFSQLDFIVSEVNSSENKARIKQSIEKGKEESHFITSSSERATRTRKIERRFSARCMIYSKGEESSITPDTIMLVVVTLLVYLIARRRFS